MTKPNEPNPNDRPDTDPSYGGLPPSDPDPMLFPVISLRFTSPVGTPPDLQDPDGRPMSIGHVAMMLIPIFQDLCAGMGVQMDITFGLIDQGAYITYTDAVEEDGDPFSDDTQPGRFLRRGD